VLTTPCCVPQCRRFEASRYSISFPRRYRRWVRRMYRRWFEREKQLRSGSENLCAMSRRISLGRERRVVDGVFDREPC